MAGRHRYLYLLNRGLRRRVISPGAPLTIGDSTVTGAISGIPAGRNRSIELKVYREDSTLGYQGSGSADIFPDSTTQVAIDLIRTTGSAAIFGRIIEDTVSTAWLTPIILNLGAQGSPTLGSVLDVDSVQVWLAAQANANQGGIDLVFMHYGSSFHLNNAVTAKAAGIANNINLTDSYDVAKIKDVRMVKVASRPADRESAQRIFATGEKIQGAPVSGGEIFLVESTGGRLAMVTVVKLVGTTSAGTVEVRVERSSLP